MVRAGQLGRLQGGSWSCPALPALGGRSVLPHLQERWHRRETLRVGLIAHCSSLLGIYDALGLGPAINSPVTRALCSNSKQGNIHKLRQRMHSAPSKVHSVTPVTFCGPIRNIWKEASKLLTTPPQGTGQSANSPRGDNYF